MNQLSLKVFQINQQLIGDFFSELYDLGFICQPCAFFLMIDNNALTMKAIPFE